jgi:hypothetical protein
MIQWLEAMMLAVSSPCCLQDDERYVFLHTSHVRSVSPRL